MGLDNVFAYINRLFHSWYLFFSGKICLGEARDSGWKALEWVVLYSSKIYEYTWNPPQRSL